jgi:hypothetical protein
MGLGGRSTGPSHWSHLGGPQMSRASASVPRHDCAGPSSDTARLCSSSFWEPIEASNHPRQMGKWFVSCI